MTVMKLLINTAIISSDGDWDNYAETLTVNPQVASQFGKKQGSSVRRTGGMQRALMCINGH
jgi:hypothetical protein